MRGICLPVKTHNPIFRPEIQASDLIETCAALANGGRTIVVASLSAGHERSQLTLDTSAFLAQCDQVTFMVAVCRCGKDASVTHRHTIGTSLIGGAEQYEALCRICYKKLSA